MYQLETRFLIVDDMVLIRKAQIKILTGLGYFDFVEASDGLMALKAIHSETPPIEIIICDWKMPNMSGLAFLKIIRSNPLTKDVPFIMVTAESEKAQIIDAIKAGVSDYIIKPFSRNDLVEKLTNTYSRKKSTVKS